MPRTTRTLSRPSSRTALPTLLLGTSLALHAGLYQPLLAAGSQAHAEQAAQTYAIAAGPLGAALNRFARESGVVLSFDAALTNGRSTAGLQGRYSVEQGFAALLSGSGLQVFKSGDSYLLTETKGAAGALQLGATNVNAEGLGAVTEGSGSYTTGSVSIGKLPTSIKDTPQSVSVMTRQRIEDQNLNTIYDVVTQTTGVSAYQGSTQASRFLARGFEITNFRVDGGAAMNTDSLAWKDMDMAIYDHVEILRGADGLYSGNGEPGGTINLVRKRPTAVNQFGVTQSIGSWDNYRTELDASGPLGFDGRLRGRSVLVYQDRNGFMDEFDVDRKLFHGVLEADLTDSTLLTIGYTQDRFKSSEQAYGLPRFINGDDLKLSRSFYFAGSDDYKGRRADSVYVNLEQKLNENWLVTLDTIYTETDTTREYHGFQGAIDPRTGTGPTGSWFVDKESFRDRAVDLSVKGGFELWGGQHDAVLGYNWQSYRVSTTSSTWPKGWVSSGNIFAYDSNSFPTNRDIMYQSGRAGSHVKQNGIYGSLRLQLADPLHLIIGARYNNYYYDWGLDNNDASGVYTFGLKTLYRDDKVLTPFAALTYSFDDEWTAYASMADIYLSQANNLKGPPPGSSPLDPVEGRAYEIGIKGELFDGRLNTTTAVYYTRRKGEATRDLTYPRNEAAGGAYCCYLADGEVTSKGVEFELSGQIFERLEGTFGYTYNHKEFTGGSSGARALNLTPKHLAKAFLAYRMPGSLDNLRVGAGVNVQSSSSVEEDSLSYSQSGYALYSAFADYRLTEHWSVAINGNNLTDKKYYSTLGNTGYGNFYGDPRNFMLTLRGNY